MIDIGINYLNELSEPQNKYDKIYEFLIEKGYINTLKYPGKHCTYDTLEQFISLVNKTGINSDIHGFPGITPAINSINFSKNVDWEKLCSILANINNVTKISTHIGLENQDRLKNHSNKELDQTLYNNMQNLKNILEGFFKNKIEIGLENIPGGFDFDPITLSPDFVSDNWKISDFGVFDISHAKLSAQQLNISYENYLNNLKYKEKVKIIHISGNIDTTNKYDNKPDKHVLIHSDEIKDILKTIELFNNIELIISEYAFNTKYSYEKEIIIEAIITYLIVKTRNYYICADSLNYLENNLKNDISNAEEVVNYMRQME